MAAHKKNSSLERLPEYIFDEILSKFDEENDDTLPTLCSLTCVSRTLNSSVNKHLFSLSSVNLSAFSLDLDTLNLIRTRFGTTKKIILNCYRLDDLSIKGFLGEYVEEVHLLKATSVTYHILFDILKLCPKLRVLLIELSDYNEMTKWGTNVTDAGMTVLGKSNAPISCLSLRGCKRVTDEEITYLLEGEGKIGKTLSSLDLGHMPGITDNAITTIVDVCVGLLELCIRNCFHVTDETIKALALRGSLQDGK
ncbi:F-box domain, cyclin-like protein [Tanacetum coccineum]